jgi:hypothetical protein
MALLKHHYWLPSGYSMFLAWNHGLLAKSLIASLATFSLFVFRESGRQASLLNIDAFSSVMPDYGSPALLAWTAFLFYFVLTRMAVFDGRDAALLCRFGTNADRAARGGGVPERL